MSEAATKDQTKKPCAIFLIGMMASGKSTVGKVLAQKLGWKFYDVDRVVEERTGVSVSYIFEREGEAGFRSRETAVMAELTALSGVVVSMGGGAPMFEINRRLLARGVVVELLTTVSDVIERTRRDKSRPLLQSEDPVKRVRDLMLERAPVYHEVSDVHVSTSRTSVYAVVDAVLAHPAVQNAVRNAKEKGQIKS